MWTKRISEIVLLNIDCVFLAVSAKMSANNVLSRTGFGAEIMTVSSPPRENENKV